MNDLRGLARAFRSDATDPGQVFSHRLRIGLAIAALILVFSFLW